MDILSAIFRQQSRRIGLLIPSVVVSEKHSDALEITEHPVEKPTTNSASGFIADHAYKRPSEVTMECGFAGGGSLLDFIDTSSIGLSAGLSPKETYQQLLDLQSSRVPFDVVTGKRVYSNMLVRAIEVTTDKTSENVLNCTLTLREKGINFRSITDGVDLKTASGRYNFRNILSAAQYESDLNSERTLAGLAVARA
ncbi:recombinase family protein [Escherichia coli]|nr:recombinase family protein [Escherichia coli]